MRLILKKERKRYQRYQVNKEKIKTGVWGAVGSAIMAIIIGFAWDGWVLGSNSQTAAENSVLDRLTSICVAQFNSDPERDKKLKELKEIHFWKRAEFIEKGGWDKMPGQKEADDGIARSCSDGLELLVKK